MAQRRDKQAPAMSLDTFRLLQLSEAAEAQATIEKVRKLLPRLVGVVLDDAGDWILAEDLQEALSAPSSTGGNRG